MLIEFVVAKGKKEQSRSYAHLDGTRVVGAAAGPAERPADIVFTVTPDDAVALRDGSLDLSVGFMRGQVKMAGDFGALLRLLPRTAGETPAVPVSGLLVPGD
jgi:SCP-2 sterol transfer family